MQPGSMLPLLVPLLLGLVLAVVVLAVVAIPARRAGRDVLTARGEDVFVRVKSGAGPVAAQGNGASETAATRAPGEAPKNS